MRTARRGGGGGPAVMSMSFPFTVMLVPAAFFLGIFIHRDSCTPTSSGSTTGQIAALHGAKKVSGHGNDMKIGIEEDGCDTIEAHIEDGDYYSKSKENAWRQLKWGLPPAKCPVNGHLIERLDPLYNYRRGVALDFTNDVDDKTHIEQWFLGTKVDLNKRRRRVLIDVGSNYYNTSVVWFQQRYPCDFTEVHAFEAVSTMFRLPAGFDEDGNWEEYMWGGSGLKKVKGRQPGNMPQWMIDRIHPYNQQVGLEDIPEKSKVNLTRFIKNELKLTADDAVVVKMDIEGDEWPILESWLKDPDMPKIIDELWVELHYLHPDNGLEWMMGYSREQATRMLAELRFKGWYAHYWD